MRVVLDTNVLISGLAFGGTPGVIVDAWRRNEIVLVTSPEIIDEYARVAERLSRRYGLELPPLVAALVPSAEVVPDSALPEAVCSDPDDDKFIACALTAGVRVVVSGDKALCAVGEYAGVAVIRPAAFARRFLG